MEEKPAKKRKKEGCPTRRCRRPLFLGGGRLNRSSRDALARPEKKPNLKKTKRRRKKNVLLGVLIELLEKGE